MKLDDDEQSRDPQSTLPPRLSRQTRAQETQGRKLILGTPRATSPAQAASDAHRGFTLGKKHVAPAAAEAPKRLVQPWILFVAGGALLLLVVALLLRPSGVSNAEGTADQKVLAQYTKYLETKKGANGINIEERRKEVTTRLQAVSWAKAVDDKAALENELTSLLFLDDDKSSPLYEYSVKELKALGRSKKRAGL